MTMNMQRAKASPGYLPIKTDAHKGPDPEFLPPPPPEPASYYDNEWYEARREHAWLLRAEGLTLKPIAKRLDTSITTIQHYISRFGRRVARAIQRPFVPIDEDDDYHCY